MATIETFEGLVAWQKAKTLANAVYAMSRTEELAKDFGLRDQMRRAAVSVMSNIAEGFERGTTADFIHFLYIAKGSVGELRAQLHLVSDQRMASADHCEQCRLLAVETGRLVSGLIVYLKTKQQRETCQKKPRKPVVPGPSHQSFPFGASDPFDF